MASMERGIPNGTPRALAERDLLFEFMINALRLNAGFDEQLFEARTGLSRDALRQRLQAPLQKGLIAPAAENVWRPTPLGRRFLNDLQEVFLPELPRRLMHNASWMPSFSARDAITFTFSVEKRP
jgi:coproporphyrinogen III oxidase-like Fe-S oxidoreductase